jgi:hypothetical protein
MSKVRYDIKKVTREMLEEVINKYTSTNWVAFNADLDDDDLCPWALAIRKAAEVKPRTQAEVDADIAKAVRNYSEWHANTNAIEDLTFHGYYGYPDKTLCRVFRELLAEETQD